MTTIFDIEEVVLDTGQCSNHFHRYCMLYLPGNRKVLQCHR